MAAGLRAAPIDVSTVVGVHKLTLSAGPNFLSAPLHRAPAHRGAVAGVSTATITFSGSPGWTADQFGPHDGHSQYIALLRNDASANPGNQGDWWPVTGNAANSVTVDVSAEDLPALVGSGDEIEIRRLTSLRDLFGTGASLRLNKDSDGSASSVDEDVIYFVSGTSFSSEVFYHDGSLAPEGFYRDGAGPLDGSTLTVGPDEAIMVMRKTGSAPMDVYSAGHVQDTRLTHYLAPGATPVGTGFPVDSAVGLSGLVACGWKADSDGSANAADDDLLYSVLGSAFSDEVFLHDGSLAPYGWYANGTANDAFALGSAKGFVAFVQNPAGLRWRQPVPF